MDRIIEVKITGCHLTKSSNLAGVAGEANVTALRIEFDESWDGYAKTITWLDASGETATGVILTADLLEDIIESTRVYIAPIPKAALNLAGETLFSVDGYMNGKRQRSVYGKLIVRQGGEFEAIDDVDGTTAEEIQSQLETHLEEIQAALAGAEAARDESVQSAASAKEYRDDCWERSANIRENPDATDGDIINTHLTVGWRGGDVGENSFVSGGAEVSPNTASGQDSFAGGGYGNTASSYGSFVGGGTNNTANNQGAFVGGGHNNSINGHYSFVGGGESNIVNGQLSFIGGGYCNMANGSSGFVGGGVWNTALPHQTKFGHYSKGGKQGEETGTAGDALIIGNGESISNRSNAMRVTYGGEIYTSAGYGTEEKKVATEEYVDKLTMNVEDYVKNSGFITADDVTPEVFVAVYGETPFKDVEDAYLSGKAIIVHSDDMYDQNYFPLVWVVGTYDEQGNITGVVSFKFFSVNRCIISEDNSQNSLVSRWVEFYADGEWMSRTIILDVDNSALDANDIDKAIATAEGTTTIA